MIRAIRSAELQMSKLPKLLIAARPGWRCHGAAGSALRPTPTGRASAGPRPPASPTASSCLTPGMAPPERTCAGKWQCPGLAHSSPIVWGDRIFVTSAISSRADVTFKPGLYGEGTASEDRTPQQWVVIALERSSGKTAWTEVAYEGVPKEKRHIKATYANATPFTDGRYVVAFFGSQGLYAFDMQRQAGVDEGPRASSTPAPTICRSTSGAPRARRSSTRTW